MTMYLKSTIDTITNISLINKRQLTSADIKKLDYDVVVNALFIDDIDDADYLIEQDYVWCELTKDGTNYIMIHGYPGDNSSGIIFKTDNPIIIIAHIGECMDSNNMNDWQKWYMFLNETECLTDMFVL